MYDRHDRSGTKISTFRGACLALVASLCIAGPAAAQGVGIPGVTAPGPGMSQGVQMPSVLGGPPAQRAPAQSAPAESAPQASSAPLAGGNCNEDIGRLVKRRMASIEALNAIAKRNKGKLDPVAACPKFRSLIKVEKEFEAYLAKNKDWCNVPDQVVANVKEGSAKDAKIGHQACTIAAQVLKARRQQEAGGGLGGGAAAAAPRLPTGPL